MRKPSEKAGLKRLSMAALPLLTVIAAIGFWRLAPGTTFIIAALAMVILLVALWIAGKDPS